MDKKRIRTVFLDYDGTLHNSMHIYKPAFLKAYRYLEKHHGAPKREWTYDEISQFLGQTPTEMWNAFGKGLSDEAKNKASSVISEEMRRLIEAGEARLFEGALDTLHILKERGYALVFISNCKNYYMHAHAETFGLDKLFDRMVCSETYPGVEEKHQVLAKTMEDFSEEMVIVGDRTHDIKAGKINGIHTIGAAYGFARQGELDDADQIISNVRELTDIL